MPAPTAIPTLLTFMTESAAVGGGSITVPGITSRIFPTTTLPTPSMAVPTRVFLGDGVLPLPQRLMKKILALEFIEMRELLPEEWLSSAEVREQESHSCCNSAAQKLKAPITNIFTWLQGYASLVVALSTAHPSKVSELMAYQSTILRCYGDFESPAWVQYDQAYRRQATITKTLNWSQINTTLYSLCFAGRAKRNHICTHCRQQ